MRKLNSLEKEIVDKLVNSYALKEQGLYLCSKFLEDNYIGASFEMSLAVKCKDKKVLMLIPKKETDFEDFQRGKIIFIITFFNLIKDLQDSRKIYLIGDSDKEGLLGPKFSEKVSFAPDLDAIICDTFFKLIAVSQDLFEYVKNGFKTDEEIRHNQTLKISRIGIWVAILIGLSSIILSLYLDNKVDNTLKLDPTQFDNLIQHQNKAINNQDKMNESLLRYIDTVNINNSDTKHRH
jgi:hypothetical protein